MPEQSNFREMVDATIKLHAEQTVRIVQGNVDLLDKVLIAIGKPAYKAGALWAKALVRKARVHNCS